MIFGTGFGIFVLAYLFTRAKHPEKAGLFLSLAGFLGMILMLVSVCMLIARYMP